MPDKYVAYAPFEIAMLDATGSSVTKKFEAGDTVTLPDNYTAAPEQETHRGERGNNSGLAFTVTTTRRYRNEDGTWREEKDGRTSILPLSVEAGSAPVPVVPPLAPKVPPAPVDVDVPGLSVAKVLEAVEAGEITAKAALKQEQKSPSPRVTLISELEKIIADA